MEDIAKKRRTRGQGALGDITATKQTVMEMQRRQEDERRQKTERLRAQRLAKATGSKNHETASGPA
ncbi:hypothetical protein C8J36_10765 [Rhizobium sp. PP-F2F-G48]|uniref:hypothetical protein n=1 Tax=Rhizobium sp. PP-F2F-G48 TaxID=2135651 RepID=UPI00104AFAE9|nr:hypothetical protein [Rhizobium sp. PP-F2F-G48]TCM53103.1 hypothetical protein C8J36_10765 [Rhizobium sp. PP-F2F-G48]